jgi:hypothetical protein
LWIEYIKRHAESTQIVLDERGERVAFMSAHWTNKFPYGVSYGPTYDIDYVFIDFLYCKVKKRGYGRCMLEKVQELAVEKNVDVILSSFETCNETAKNWHLEKQGFESRVRLFKKHLFLIDQ